MSMKSFGRFCSGPILARARAEEQHQLAAFELARPAQPPPPFRHCAHGCAAGAGADHHDVALRMVRHQEAGAERADHVDLVALLQIAHVVARDAAHRVALMVLEHALDRQRQVVVARPLAVARTGDRVLARVVRATGGIDARRHDADRLAFEHRERRRAEVEHDVVRVVVAADLGHAHVAGDRRRDRLLRRLRAVEVGIGVRRRPGRQLRAELRRVEDGDAGLLGDRRGGRRRERRLGFDGGAFGQLGGRQLVGQHVPAELRFEAVGAAARHPAPVVDGAGRARRDAGVALLALRDVDDVVARVVRDRADRAGGLAGVAADADLRVDQVLPDDPAVGHVHARLLPRFRKSARTRSRSAGG